MKATPYFLRLSAALLLALAVTPLAYAGMSVGNLIYIGSGSSWIVIRTISIAIGMLLLVGPIFLLVVMGKSHRLPGMSFRSLFRWQLIILVSLMAFGLGLAEAATHLY